MNPGLHVNRGLLGWGVFFVVAGAVPLAIQSGLVNADVVRNFWELWPLVLIGIGLGLILQRTKAAFVGGLVIAVTFGLLVGGWFAVGFSPGFGTCGVGSSGTHGDPFPTQSGSFAAPASVSLDLSCGDMTVTSAGGNAWTVAGSSEGAVPPTVTAGRDLKVESPHHSGLDFGHAADWQVSLPTGVPVSLGLTGNAGSIEATLGAMQVPDLHASVNAGSATIDMAEVTGLESIDISANAGSLSLTLPAPAGTMTGSISANAGSVELCVPARRRAAHPFVEQPARFQQLRRPRHGQRRRDLDAGGVRDQHAAHRPPGQREPRQRQPQPGRRL